MPSEKGTDCRTKKLLENEQRSYNYQRERNGIHADRYVRKAVKAVFKDGILKEQGVRRHVRKNDRISYDVYSLELVIAVAFRIDSIESRAFREFIMQAIIKKQTNRPKLVCLWSKNIMV